MFWEQIKEKPSAQFKRLTGVQKKTFMLMVQAVRVHDDKIVRKKGNYRSRPFSLDIEDQVLLTLMYYREYRTQFHIGGTYGISESAVCRTIQRIENILQKIKELQLPGKKVLSGRSQEFSVVLIDATEMVVERPKKNKSNTTVAKRSDTR
jgi:hypothetical protein